jgi:hypothetical protein
MTEARPWLADVERVEVLDLCVGGPLRVISWVSRFRDGAPVFPCARYSISKPGATHDGCYYRLAWVPADVEAAG